MSMSLYNLTGEWIAMRDQLAASGFDETTMADTLDAESMPYDEKVVGVAMVSEEFDHMGDGKIALGKKIIEEGMTLKRRASGLKTYLADSLAKTGRTDVRGDLIRVRLYMNRDESVEIKSADDIPLSFMKTKTETYPDKTAIKAALKNGGEVPGAELVKKDRLSFLH